MQRTKRELFVIDPYSGSTTLELIATIRTDPRVRVLKGSRAPSDFIREVKAFAKQHRSISIEVRDSDAFHDRFIILDSETVFFVGASIKDAANKAFAVFAVESQPLREVIIQYAEQIWQTALRQFPKA